MKKALIAVVAVASLVVAACGGDDATTTAPTDTDAPATDATEPPNDTDAPATDATEPPTETEAPPSDAQEVVIGAAVAKTGFMSAFDVPALATLEIAVDRLNEDGGLGGRPVRIESLDTRSDRAEAANAALRLIDDGADVIITTCDFDFGGPAALVAEDAGIVAIAPCSSDVKFGPLGLGPFSFSLGTPNLTEGAAMAAFALEEKDWETAYVLTDDSIEYTKEMCRAFVDRYSERGGTVIGEDLFQQGDTSISAQVSRLAAVDVDPDVVILCSYPPGGATATLQLRQGGIDAPILAGFGMDGSYWLDAIPDLSDFYVLTLASIFGDDPNPDVQELADAYDARTGAAVVDLLVQAYSAAGNTLEGVALRDAMRSLDVIETIAGPTSFSEEVHISLDRPLLVLEVHGGVHRYITTVEPREVEELLP